MSKKIVKKVNAKAQGTKSAKKPAVKAKAPVKKAVPAKAAVKKTVKVVAKATAKPVKKPAAKLVAKKSAPKAAPKKVAVKPAPKAAVKPAAKAPQKAQQKAQVLKAPVKQAPKAQGKEAPKAAPAQQAKVLKVEPKKSETATGPKPVYKVGVHVVYPTHGVGKIVAEETQMIGDHELRMLVIAFDKDKMTLRVPVHRAAAAGLRPVSSIEQMKKVFVSLKGRARTSRGMWSRRAQEYEAKINSGNIFSIAEVVRDLHQNVDQSERSYSERMIYESALSRLVGELAAAEGIDLKNATDKVMKLLRAKHAAPAAEPVKEAA